MSRFRIRHASEQQNSITNQQTSIPKWSQNLVKTRKTRDKKVGLFSNVEQIEKCLTKAPKMEPKWRPNRDKNEFGN